MSKTPLRVGIWFQENHTPYGGPGVVLTGTILGLFQYAQETGNTIVVLLNEQGDVNWSLGLTPTSSSDMYKMPHMWCGPACFNRADALSTPQTSDTWNAVYRALFPSNWFAEFVSKGLPYLSNTEDHTCAIWPAGVDTDYFCPSQSIEKTQDYFIYFKSQNYADLQKIQAYLFHNWFGIKGHIMTYYTYDPTMLRTAARAAKFCILLDDTETQGLAALEIMACDCPLFVLDKTQCIQGDDVYDGATSVTEMDTSCGMKSSFDTFKEDFPLFLSKLETYSPRKFVCAQYTYAAAARRLLEIINPLDTSSAPA